MSDTPEIKKPRKVAVPKVPKAPKAPPTLDELYAKIETLGKVTPSVEKAIRIHPDSSFSTINSRYCNAICRLQCKDPHATERYFVKDHVDILFVQDHRSVPTKFENSRGFFNRDELPHQGILDFLVAKAGLKEAGVTWASTSLLRCKPTHQDFPGGKPPTETKMQKCSPYLKAEIERTSPKVIVTFGTASTKALGIKHVSNSGNRGQIAFAENSSLPVVVTLHPRILSYIRQNARGAGGFWGPDYFNVILRDIIKAKKLATGEISYTPSTLEQRVESLRPLIRIARTLEDVKDIMAQIEALPLDAIISFDTETTGVDPLAHGFKLLTIQFGWFEEGTIKAAVIPLWHRKNSFYDANLAWELVIPFLIGRRPKTGHNSKFDILAIYWATGIRVKEVVNDSLLMLHTLESGTQGCYSLKTALWDHLPELGLGGYEDLLGDLSDMVPGEDLIAETEEASNDA